MGFFNSKLRYALCASVDLAMHPRVEACQSREIASRQNIPGPYLDQILASLKAAGIVRSIRGASGGYSLARTADRISVGDVVRALMRTDRLFSSLNEDEPKDLNAPLVLWVVRDFEEQVEKLLNEHLDATSLADLVSQKSSLNDSLSYMAGI